MTENKNPPDEPHANPPAVRMMFDIPATTFFKLFFAALIAALLIKLAPLILITLLSILLGTTLQPVVEWLKEKGLSSRVALGVVILAFLGTLVIANVILVPLILDQISQIIGAFPKIHKDLLEKFPDGSINTFINKFFKDPQEVVKNLPDHMFAAGSFALDGIFTFGIFIVTSIYILIDGKLAYQWLVAFFSSENQRKIDKTAEAVSKVIFAYVAGQLITSLLVGLFTLVVLKVFKVPAALTLAVVAAVLDVLPLVGFLASSLLIVAFALTVSGQNALIVLSFCVAYHLVETYVIIPKVYGSRMRLSTLVVILSLLFASAVSGIMGAILILPLVASYPIIEKIWLKKQLGENVIRDHQDQSRSSSA